MTIGDVALAIGIGVAVVVVFALLVPYAIGRYRNRHVGGRGFVQQSRLTCPKCHAVFDYDWVPGMALTAVRLGTHRYMACPVCHRWSVFDVWHSAPAPDVAAR